jgi:hypothetical protein
LFGQWRSPVARLVEINRGMRKNSKDRPYCPN